MLISSSRARRDTGQSMASSSSRGGARRPAIQGCAGHRGTAMENGPTGLDDGLAMRWRSDRSSGSMRLPTNATRGVFAPSRFMVWKKRSRSARTASAVGGAAARARGEARGDRLGAAFGQVIGPAGSARACGSRPGVGPLVPSQTLFCHRALRGCGCGPSSAAATGPRVRPISTPYYTQSAFTRQVARELCARRIASRALIPKTVSRVQVRGAGRRPGRCRAPRRHVVDLGDGPGNRLPPAGEEAGSVRKTQW